MKSLFSLAIAAMTAALGAAPAMALTSVNNLDHRPVGAIAGELGVEPLEFEACFARVTPAAPGTSPTSQQERSNKAILLPCLQAANPAISNELLDQVMNKYRGVHVEQPY